MDQSANMQRRVVRGACPVFLLFAVLLTAKAAAAQTEFDTASIHLSKQAVKFERNGRTEARLGTLTMNDVTLSSCIQWAYSVPQALVQGSPSLTDVRYDIVAKTDPGATQQQMRLMLRALLADRFKLAFHMEKKELRVYSLVVAKGGIKMHTAIQPEGPGGEPDHQNSKMGMVGRSMSMHDLAEYLSDPLDAPLTDGTGLPGRYDFTIDFTAYVDMERNGERPDPAAVLKAALKGELGLDLVQRKEQVDVLIVDHSEPPSSN